MRARSYSWFSCVVVAAFVAAAGCSRGLEPITDAQGKRVPDELAAIHKGPGHCDWTHATFIYIGDDQYIGDPRNEVEADLVGEYAAKVPLPVDVKDTGYRSGERRLYLARDRSAVFLVRGSSTTAQRLPRAVRMVGCK